MTLRGGQFCPPLPFANRRPAKVASQPDHARYRRTVQDPTQRDVFLFVISEGPEDSCAIDDGPLQPPHIMRTHHSLIATALFVVLIIGCGPKRQADPIPDVQVDRSLALALPMARSLELRHAKDDPNGNLFLQADFGKDAIRGDLHAVMAGDEKIVLRDDGRGSDLVKEDVIFTAALTELIEEITKELKARFDQGAQKRHVQVHDGHFRRGSVLHGVHILLPRAALEHHPVAADVRDHSGQCLAHQGVVVDERDGYHQGEWEYQVYTERMTRV